MNGLRVIESVLLTEAGKPYEVRRPWRERLFSRPWRPLQATRTVTPQIPMQGGYQLANGTLVMHPETVRRIRETISENGALSPQIPRGGHHR